MGRPQVGAPGLLTVPRRMGDLTPQWVTAALASRFPGAVVSTVIVSSAAQGTNRRARLELSYSSGSGPAAVFVKSQGVLLHRLALLVLSAVDAEARLATSGVTLPITRPEAYAAATDRRHLGFVVVYEDVTLSGGRPNDATRPLTVGEVAAGLSELAQLHAAYWGRPVPASLSFLHAWQLGAGFAPVSELSLRVALARLGSVGSAARATVRRLGARRLEREFRRSAILASIGPQTVLHGDAHPGNTYSCADGRLGYFDWQLVRTGNWSHDVGYFLAGSLDPGARKRYERELLAGYLDALREAGAEPPAPGEAWERYRATPAFGLATWLHTLAFGRLQPVEVCLRTIERFAAAYEDLGTSRSLVTG